MVIMNSNTDIDKRYPFDMQKSLAYHDVCEYQDIGYADIQVSKNLKQVLIVNKQKYSTIFEDIGNN